MNIIQRNEYDELTAATREKRLEWFKEARFGMFIHYGLFSEEGCGEWLQAQQNYTVSEYERFAKSFSPKEGCADEWCRAAKEAGAKYAVMTTRHHEGFSLWNSKVNPFNSYKYCGRDLVREFSDACRKYGLRIGLYSSVMDWHHPDGGRCAYDTEARKRFTDYIEALNTELLSDYGKIDILWYDMPWPMESSESWDSANRNYRLRQLQPDLIINNRSRMAEDFGTPEGALRAEDRYWEACMTFNGISWGYIDSKQAEKYSYSPAQILRMLRNCTASGGNLLLNIGPTADGSVPDEAKDPLRRVGAWLSENGEAAYGIKTRFSGWEYGANGVTEVTLSPDKKTVYLWNYIYPENGKMMLGGYKAAPVSASVLSTGQALHAECDGSRLFLSGLPKENPDKHAGIAVIKLVFEEEVKYRFGSNYPQLHYGREY